MKFLISLKGMIRPTGKSKNNFNTKEKTVNNTQIHESISEVLDILEHMDKIYLEKITLIVVYNQSF